MIEKIDGAIVKYRRYNYVGVVMSFCLMFNVISRHIFNAHAKVKLESDTWSNCDMFCACVNLTCFFMLD